MSNWIKLSERLPEPGKEVWVLRRWTPVSNAFGSEPLTEVKAGSRRDMPLVVNGNPWDNCYWSSEGASYSDVTVAGWQEIPELADVIRAVNSHAALVATLKAASAAINGLDYPASGLEGYAQLLEAQKLVDSALSAAEAK